MDETAAASLAETIQALRQELDDALSAAPKEGVRFELGETHIEFELAITRDVSANGGVRFGVVSFGAEGKQASGTTHRIALTMQPVMVDGEGRRTPALIVDPLVRVLPR